MKSYFYKFQSRPSKFKYTRKRWKDFVNDSISIFFNVIMKWKFMYVVPPKLRISRLF